MSVVISGAFVLMGFLLAVWTIFADFFVITDDQTDALREANEVHDDRFRTLISITSVTSHSSGDCLNSSTAYTAKVLNKSRDVSFGDFPKVDIISRYNTTGGLVSKRLTHSSDWSVPSISGDNTNPNIWDPAETATISFTLSPQAQTDSKGIIAIAVPSGISDSAYFDAAFLGSCQVYWHNDPTPPTGDTTSHAVLAMDTSVPTATTLFNYDTNRDPCVGLSILEGGIGAGESDPTKHQVWRTSDLSGDLVISGDVTIDFWSALRQGQGSCKTPLGKSAEVTVFLRDRDQSGGYTEIGSGTISDADWQGGVSGDHVQKTISISSINYTLSSDHQLEAKVIVPSAASPAPGVWFAYDTTSFSSFINLP